MAWVTGAIVGGTALAGDVMSSVGGASAMAMNNKQFYANEAFQQNMLNQEENYNTQMANTQMTRRVADLKNANLNPALAYVQGGAAAPQVSGLGGGMNPVQNPNQAFGNLGAQAAGAVGSAQQVKQTGINQAQQVSTANLQSAQAVNSLTDAAMKSGAMTDNLKAQTQDALADALVKGRQATDIADSQVFKNQADAGASLASAQLNDMQKQVAQAQIPKIQADIQLIGAQTNLAGLNAVGQRIANDIQGLNENQLRLIQPSLLELSKAQAQQATLAIPEAKAQAGFWNSWAGAISPYVTLLGNAMGAAAKGAIALRMAP